MRRIILSFLIVALLLSGCGLKEYSLEADPFAHTYRVTEVLDADASSVPEEEKILVNIDALRNLYIVDDTTSYDFRKIGELKLLELKESDPRKGVWFCYKSSDRYELSVDADDAVILSCLAADEVLWTYCLKRVDTVSAHLSSAGARSHMQLNWYFTDTFPGNLQIPNRPDITNNGTLGFSVEDDSITSLTLLEEYYTDGNVEHNDYLLRKEDGFSIELGTRYKTGDQYAIYRVPYENGEYGFCLKYV